MPAVVVIAIAANDLSSPHTAALVKSAQEVLGPNVAVQVEVVGANIENAAQGPPTTAYAWLTWDIPDSRVAHLRCYVPQDKRWVQRDVTFAEQDPEAERGRTLGFVIGSIFVEGHEPGGQHPLTVPQLQENQKPATTKQFVVAAAASMAAPGDVTSLGAWIGLQHGISRMAWVGLAGEGRTGTVPQVQGGSRFFSAGALSTLRLWPQEGRAWLGLQAFAGAEYVTFVHKSDDDPTTVTQVAWVPKLEVLAHGNLDLGTASILFVDLGTNYRFGSTDVYVHQSLKAHIPAFVGVGRIGVGTKF
jgi:hypothetical protein